MAKQHTRPNNVNRSKPHSSNIRILPKTIHNRTSSSNIQPTSNNTNKNQLPQMDKRK